MPKFVEVDEVGLHGTRRRERDRAKTARRANQLASGALEMPSAV
jgi:hypothetical protein